MWNKLFIFWTSAFNKQWSWCSGMVCWIAWLFRSTYPQRINFHIISVHGSSTTSEISSSWFATSSPYWLCSLLLQQCRPHAIRKSNTTSILVRFRFTAAKLVFARSPLFMQLFRCQPCVEYFSTVWCFYMLMLLLLYCLRYHHVFNPLPFLTIMIFVCCFLEQNGIYGDHVGADVPLVLLPQDAGDESPACLDGALIHSRLVW